MKTAPLRRQGELVLGPHGERVGHRPGQAQRVGFSAGRLFSPLHPLEQVSELRVRRKGTATRSILRPALRFALALLAKK
ncbi:MAG TPA: hypothetical protein DER32_11330, partial [Deinococcus radiodurans]|nr:hypothetical protein [Deinococcus radiodurans]